MPLGRSKANFNYNLDEKRVLNFENVVNDDDNIKQDISIDVYGRAEKAEEGEQAADGGEEPAAQVGGWSRASSAPRLCIMLMGAHPLPLPAWRVAADGDPFQQEKEEEELDALLAG